MAKIIQVPIDGELLDSLDALAKQQRTPRAALIREACRRYLASERDRVLDEQYEAGYRRLPEASELGDAQAAVIAQVLPAESW